MVLPSCSSREARALASRVAVGAPAAGGLSDHLVGTDIPHCVIYVQRKVFTIIESDYRKFFF